MHARDDDVECREHVRALIEGSILVDVTRNELAAAVRTASWQRTPTWTRRYEC
jgi:hypothetical protein